MNFSQSEKDFFEESEKYIPTKEDERIVIDSTDKLKNILDIKGKFIGEKNQTSDDSILTDSKKECSKIKYRADMREYIFRHVDLQGANMANLDLSHSTFQGCNLTKTDFSGSKLDHVAFYENQMQGMNLTDCLARGASFRGQDMTGINLSGANIYATVLEDATNQDKVITSKKTKWYKMSCPEEGPFIAWKCCTDLRVVMMLVPADAKRCMGTMETGRVSRVKVLSIKSIDESKSYDWAQSTVDPDFYYETGKWVEPANGFQEDRWKDSSQGIHFFMDRNQCVDYQSK